MPGRKHWATKKPADVAAGFGEVLWMIWVIKT